MSNLQSSAPPQLPPELVMQELETILASPTFKKSNRLSGFLRYIIEQSLLGNAESLKEYQLGPDVFGRGAEYDTRIDPVVRVEARQLRFKLAEYYSNGGSADEIVISLPKGGYAPHFERRPGEAVQETLAELSPPVGRDVETGPHGRGLKALIAALVLGLLAVGSLYFSSSWNSSAPKKSSRAVNAEAEELYLKGLYAWNKRSPDSLNQAVDYFTQSIVRDPGYAKAYVGLADCYNLLREYTLMPASEAYPRAIAAAKQAIALDDSVAGAHRSLAFADFYWMWDAAGAQREVRKSLDLDSNSAQTHHWYATFLMVLGRFDEARAEIEAAQKLDPASAPILADKGLILFYSGRPEPGIALLRQVEATDPSFLSPHNYLAFIYLARHDGASYLRESKLAATLVHDQRAIDISETGEKGLAATGEGGMLKALLAERKRLYSEGKDQAYNVAQVAALLGKQEEALEYLRQSYARREPGLIGVRVTPAFEGLHTAPAFRKMLTQMGLPLPLML